MRVARAHTLKIIQRNNQIVHWNILLYQSDRLNCLNNSISIKIQHNMKKRRITLVAQSVEQFVCVLHLVLFIFVIQIALSGRERAKKWTLNFPEEMNASIVAIWHKFKLIDSYHSAIYAKCIYIYCIQMRISHTCNRFYTHLYFATYTKKNLTVLNALAFKICAQIHKISMVEIYNLNGQ